MKDLIDITNTMWTVKCIGCAISDSALRPPGGLIVVKGSSYLHQDPEVPIEGFLVVGFTRHVRSIEDLSQEEYMDFCFVLRLGRHLIRVVNGLRSVTIVQEEQSAHLHLWLFPWYDWMMKKYGPVSLNNIRTVMNYAKRYMRTPEQVHRVLHWVEEFHTIIHQDSGASGLGMSITTR